MTDDITVDCMIDDDASKPLYAHEDDAGADLMSDGEYTLRPGGRMLVGTGVRIGLPVGKLAWVTPRSGLAAKHGVTVLNAPGLIDHGYHGELKVCLVNLDPVEEFHIHKGDRIAQLVIQDCDHAVFRNVESFEESSRGESGFGSTGVSGKAA